MWTPAPDARHRSVPAETDKYKAAAEAAAAALQKATEELEGVHAELGAARSAAQQQSMRATELSIALSSAHAATAATAAELDSARAENARMAAELAALNAARAEMTGAQGVLARGRHVSDNTDTCECRLHTAAWEKLTAAFAIPMPGMAQNGHGSSH